jgi:hypothetical protein
MYAISIPGKIYHLLYLTSDFTLCGFKAQRLEVPASLKRAGLHFVSDIPANRSLCKHCAQMQARRRAPMSELSGRNARQ